jgi:hypothetical protein
VRRDEVHGREAGLLREQGVGQVLHGTGVQDQARWFLELPLDGRLLGGLGVLC